MKKLTLELTFADGELEKSIQFLHKNPEHTPLIMEDYFKEGVITIDMNNIQSSDERFYHMNGLTALMITLKDTQDVTS